MTRRSILLVAAGLVAGLAGGYQIEKYRLTRPAAIQSAFHILFHKLGDQTYQNTWWRGVHVQKCPMDLWTYQEILWETKPDVLVECGTFKGGSAYYFASLMDGMGVGRVVTIDIEDKPAKPQHPRITYLLGSSTAPEILEKVKSLIRPGERVMVSLDSDHRAAHVQKELELYSPLVTPGMYLVVEDMHFNGHPILPKFGPGPTEAVEAFLKTNPPFERDRTRERFLLTFNPGGYLRRTAR
jgi:cephalosporin hydroxylase